MNSGNNLKELLEKLNFIPRELSEDDPVHYKSKYLEYVNERLSSYKKLEASAINTIRFISLIRYNVVMAEAANFMHMTIVA